VNRFSLSSGPGQVIRDWNQGGGAMRVGDKVRLTIPPELAMESRVSPGAISTE
jgi:FKBP-type peptidyl-prolyl cis-trans isomerase